MSFPSSQHWQNYVYFVQQKHIRHETCTLDNFTNAYWPLYDFCLQLNYNRIPLFSADKGTLTCIISAARALLIISVLCKFIFFLTSQAIRNTLSYNYFNIDFPAYDSSRCHIKVNETVQTFIFNYTLKPIDYIM